MKFFSKFFTKSNRPQYAVPSPSTSGVCVSVLCFSAVLAMMLSPSLAMAADTDWLKTGTAIDGRATDGIKIAMAVIRVALIGFMIYEFVMFWRKKEWLPLVYGLLACAGVYYAPTLVTAAADWGSKTN